MIFKEFVEESESYGGYILSSIMRELSEDINEGRVNRNKLSDSDFTYKQKTDKTLFGDEEVGSNPGKKVDKLIDDEGGHCPVTPLSGYSSHIGTIQSYAHSSPENFAQVLMFSPLSANTPFAKHWDNYQMLMSILKHKYPKRVSVEEIRSAVRAFDDKYHKLTHTIAGFKLETIADIWSNKESLFHKLNSIAKSGDDVSLIQQLTQIKGVAPVKAGFIVQLLWGRAGCIDTHNIDIYSKVFPDMAGDFDERKWGKGKKNAAQDYVKVLDKLNSRGIGTKQLWDVWVDFVETMYVMITHHGKGYYDMQGGGADSGSGEYDALRGIYIPKWGIGKDRGGVMVPLLGGDRGKSVLGMGASATHLPMDPDDALKKFHHLYMQGGIDSPLTPDMAAYRAVKFRKGSDGRSLDQNLGKIPTALHYLHPAINNGEVDRDRIRDIINSRLQAKKKRVKVDRQRELF